MYPPPLGENLRLHERHATALGEALAWLPTIVTPVAVVASGSIVRGNPGPGSDLDLVILHDGAWRRRVQRRFARTPVELLFNSEAWLRDSIRREVMDGRPVMPHLLATGTILFDPTGRMGVLVGLARQAIERGPPFDEDALLRDRYAAACRVEDALDVADLDTPDAHQLLAAAIDGLVRHAYLAHDRFVPRPKDRLAGLSDVDPVLAALLATAATASRALALDALRGASTHLLGTTGFFEWDSGPEREPLSP